MKAIELGSHGVGSDAESWYRLEFDEGKPYWVHTWRHKRTKGGPDIGELRVALDVAAGRPYHREALSIAAKFAGVPQSL